MDEGGEECMQFSKLLEQVKLISELQNSGAHHDIDKEVYLRQLQRRADDIRDILARIQRQKSESNLLASIPQQPKPTEIYQNLGPLMGSGCNAAPTLPPKQSGQF